MMRLRLKLDAIEKLPATVVSPVILTVLLNVAAPVILTVLLNVVAPVILTVLLNVTALLVAITIAFAPELPWRNTPPPEETITLPPTVLPEVTVRSVVPLAVLIVVTESVLIR